MLSILAVPCLAMPTGRLAADRSVHALRPIAESVSGNKHHFTRRSFLKLAAVATAASTLSKHNPHNGQKSVNFYFNIHRNGEDVKEFSDTLKADIANATKKGKTPIVLDEAFLTFDLYQELYVFLDDKRVRGMLSSDEKCIDAVDDFLEILLQNKQLNDMHKAWHASHCEELFQISSSLFPFIPTQGVYFDDFLSSGQAFF